MSVNTFEKIINNLNIDTSKVPKHIAVIMDGNGRWAKKRKLPRIAGHRKGAKNVTNIVEAAGEIGVKFMTIYTFSIENWNRPKKEVDSLMNLFEEVLTAKLPQLMKKSVRLNLIGDLSSIPETTRKKFNDAVDKTSKNDGLVLTVALNYGGRDEITRAINKMLKNGVRQVDEETVSKYLDTNNV
ncbi:MAG: di-trans,poly-cis-decaprenylcistransferase, partial [Actinobacteria bacterium]